MANTAKQAANPASDAPADLVGTNTQSQEENGQKAEKTAIPAGLTLQQKFIKLREAVPAITQRQHSDGVKYKFAKIFDVYELLTPAMNAWGVNFDIIEEKATRHDQNGDPLYYHSYTQLTNFGKERTVWVYEADLTVCWTNADDPFDTLTVTLHALGTNDGGPDKAKGSAWTYCLKYYLFEKFGIDQGDDDPDMKDMSDGVVQLPQNRASAPSNASGGRNTQPQNKNGQNGQNGANKTLSDAQLTRMYKKGEAAGYTQEQVNARITKKYGHQEAKNMSREQYEETCNALDAVANQGGNQNV